MSNKFTQTELELFVAHTCSRCFQPDEARARAFTPDPPLQHGCPHLHRAMVRDQMPGVWTRRRNGPLGETFKCEAFVGKPPVNRRGTVADETPPMFDAEPDEKLLVPVEGWPDYRGRDRKDREGDHQ